MAESFGVYPDYQTEEALLATSVRYQPCNYRNLSWHNNHQLPFDQVAVQATQRQGRKTLYEEHL